MWEYLVSILQPNTPPFAGRVEFSARTFGVGNSGRSGEGSLYLFPTKNPRNIAPASSAAIPSNTSGLW